MVPLSGKVPRSQTGVHPAENYPQWRNRVANPDRGRNGGKIVAPNNPPRFATSPPLRPIGTGGILDRPVVETGPKIVATKRNTIGGYAIPGWVTVLTVSIPGKWGGIWLRF